MRLDSIEFINYRQFAQKYLLKCYTQAM